MTLRVERVTARRQGSLIVDGVECLLPSGAVTAIVGPNGAGKSTLLHLVAGVLAPTEGAVRIDGSDLSRMPRRDRARSIALVEQHGEGLADTTVHDLVVLGRTPYLSAFRMVGEEDRSAVDRALRAAGADSLAERRFGSLSGGERQRVALARALAQEPEVLLLDEPTNHLDVRARLETLALLRELAGHGLTVVVALHDLDHAVAYADRVVVLSGGRAVASGSAVEVLTPDLVASVYGVRVELVANPFTGRPQFAYGPVRSSTS